MALRCCSCHRALLGPVNGSGCVRCSCGAIQYVLPRDRALLQLELPFTATPMEPR